MRLRTITGVGELTNEEIDGSKLDIVIVEGPDGVGKGRFIKDLVKRTGWKVYRPDYKYWNNHITRKQRWLIFRGYIEVIKLSGVFETIIIDRGMLSGAVYNCDPDLAKEYADLVRGTRSLHVLVTTDKNSFYKMQGIRRGIDIPKEPYVVCHSQTERYKEYMDEGSIPYIEFHNAFNNKIGHKNMGKCGGCDNWNTLRQDYDSEKLIGICSHWGTEFSEDADKCSFYEKGDVHADKM